MLGALRQGTRAISKPLGLRSHFSLQKQQANLSVVSDMVGLPVRQTRLAFVDTVGAECLRGELLSLGPLLKQLDNFGGVLAENAIAKTVAMAAVDHVEIVGPVVHGDVVRFEGEVINTGRSSLTVQITGYRHDLATRQFVHSVDAVMTLVALDQNLRPSAGLPALIHPDDETYVAKRKALAKRRKELSTRWQSGQNSVDQLPHIALEMLDGSSRGVDSSDAMSVKETSVALSTAFLPRHLNRHGTVFGGEILSWMDKTALYCGKAFTGNSNMLTESVSHLSFKMPITTNDIVAMEARVCGVREHHVEVEVEVFLSRFGAQDRRKSHTGYFTVANRDASNQKQRVSRELARSEEEQDDLRVLLKAQHRRLLRDEERKLLQLQPLALSAISGSRL